MSAACRTCGRALDLSSDMASRDCGGDCLGCMAAAGDPDAVAALAIRTGDRVELHPATDWWMRGARYGAVVQNRLDDPPGYLRVQLDAVAHQVLLPPDDIHRKV